MKRFKTRKPVKESEKTELDKRLDIIESMNSQELKKACYELEIAVQSKKYTEDKVEQK